MKASSKAQAQERMAPIHVPAQGLEITTNRNLSTASVLNVTNRIMDVVGTQTITGHRPPTQRGRHRSAFAGSLPAVIAAASVNALATGALNASTSANSELFVDFPSPDVRWNLAHGVSLRTGKLALDWLMKVTICVHDGKQFFKIETSNVTMHNDVIVNGFYYDRLKAALTHALKAPVDDTTTWEPTSDLRAFSVPYHGDWAPVYEAWAELVGRMIPPTGSSSKRASTTYSIGLQGSAHDANHQSHASSRARRVTTKDATDLFWRWRLRTRMTGDNGCRVELAPTNLRYSGNAWRDQEDLATLWGTYRQTLEKLGRNGS